MSSAGAATAAALRSELVVQVDPEVSINTKPITDIASTADPRRMVGAVRTRPPTLIATVVMGVVVAGAGANQAASIARIIPRACTSILLPLRRCHRGRAMNRRVGPELRHVAKCGRHPPSQPAPPCVRTAPWHGRKSPTLSASSRGAFLTIRLKRSCNSWARTYEI